MACVSLFCTPIWRPWRLPKRTWPIPSHLESYLNRTLGRKRPVINLWPCSRQKLYKYRHPFPACDSLSEKRGAQLCTFDQAWSEIPGGGEGEGLVKSKSNLSIIYRSSKLRVIFIPCVRVREVKSIPQWWALWGIFLSNLQQYWSLTGLFPDRSKIACTRIIISLTKQITSFTSVTSTTESYILPILFSTAIHTQIPQIWEYPLPLPGQDVVQKCPGGTPIWKGGWSSEILN